MKPQNIDWKIPKGVIIFLLMIAALFAFPTPVYSQACVCEGHTGEAGCCVGNYGSACGNCGTIACDGSCSNQGVCSPGVTQCANGVYETCSSSCAWANTGTDVDGDSVSQQCEDSTCDSAAGVCDTAISGKCVAISTPEICADGLDNDCSNGADAQDSFCNGQVSGLVADNEGSPVSGANVKVYHDSLTILGQASTNPSGLFGPIEVPFGNHSMVASHPDYVPRTMAVNLGPQESVQSNFTGNDALYSSVVCEDDCTYTGDSTIHQECSGINGCSFYDAQAAATCDNAQPGWIKAYSETEQIECAEGLPYAPASVKATVTCGEGNLIKTTKVVSYQGKLVKMVVVTCG